MCICPKIVKDVKNVEKSRFWSRSQIFYDFGFGFKKFGIGKKYRFRFRKIWYRKEVSVLVSEFLVSEKKYRFRFRKNLVSEKSLDFGFGKFGIRKKVSVLVSVKILVLSFSGHNLLQTQGFNLKCNNHGHKLTMKVF